MAKIRIAPALFSPPMPVALIGANVEGKPNFMTAAWVTRVNFDPPMIAVAISSGHFTPRGIRENKTFSVCLPGASLVEKTDYCGIVSGKRADKSETFEVFYGDLATAPMAAACPLCVECLLAQIVELPSNLLVLGNIASMYADEAVLSDGKPDPEKSEPLVLTMPDNCYRRLGPVAGTAWSAGKSLKKKT